MTRHAAPLTTTTCRGEGQGQWPISAVVGPGIRTPQPHRVCPVWILIGKFPVPDWADRFRTPVWGLAARRRAARGRAAAGGGEFGGLAMFEARRALAGPGHRRPRKPCPVPLPEVPRERRHRGLQVRRGKEGKWGAIQVAAGAWRGCLHVHGRDASPQRGVPTLSFALLGGCCPGTERRHRGLHQRNLWRFNAALGVGIASVDVEASPPGSGRNPQPACAPTVFSLPPPHRPTSLADVRRTHRGVFLEGARGALRGRYLGENPGPRTEPPLEAPLTPCLPPPLPRGAPHSPPLGPRTCDAQRPHRRHRGRRRAG